MLIDDYEIELSTPACDLSSPVYLVKISLSADISEALPYLNATVEKGEFIPGIPVLVFRENARKYAVRAREIAISNIADREDAEEQARAIVERVNAVWEDRANLAPSYETWEKPKVLEVFKHLPRTNCGQCGAPTCMAFAADLAKGKKCLEDCPPLVEDACSQSLVSLREMGL